MVEGKDINANNIVPRIDTENVHWIDLFVDYMLQNKPCILKATATKNWKSRKEWVLSVPGAEHQQVPNFDYFAENYGELVGPLYDEENCEQTNIQVSEYMQYAKTENHRNGIKYLKDWHFQKDSGTSYDFYGLPSFLQFDWINNEKWSDADSCPFGDYRFVYFGIKDTWTVFHSDVMSSYSWSANICGRKLWYFVPVGNERYFQIHRDTYLKNICDRKEDWIRAGVISFVQEPGEIVFVPSNWYHQVHNLEDAVSINHNFFNASNIDRALALIFLRLQDVYNEIEDVRDVFTKQEFNDQCQRILQADIRINFHMFQELVVLVANDRQEKVDQCWVCPRHRNIFDCKKDTNCMKRMKEYVKGNCCCSDLSTRCDSCKKFINMYELSCAVQIQYMITNYLKEQKS